jgi:prepilin-type N-terminal cleavage/methylation domain-containing protein/prepilin-type processing-associated H-X9-DG protein
MSRISPDSCHRRPNPGPAGFTLIELLVVIAIIAILAAILFPVFAQAREKARQAACQSNEKQIALGLLQYLQDYDDTYAPHYIDYSTTGSPRISWRTLIEPYLKNGGATGDVSGVFVCPSSPMNEVTTAADKAKVHYQMVCDYDMDPECFGSSNVLTCNGRGFVYRSIDFSLTDSMLREPASTIFITETPDCNKKGTKQCVSNEARVCQPQRNAAGVEYTPSHYKVNNNWANHVDVTSGDGDKRHNGGVNYIFFDGHTKWMKTEATISPKNLWTANDTD